MFDTVGRYRDPEASVRRAAAGCLTAFVAFSTVSGTILFWLAVWLWPYFLELCRWIVAIFLRLLFGQEVADAWLAQVIVEPVPVEIAVIETEIGEPYVEDDPVLTAAPLPGELPAPPPPEPMAVAELADLVPIAHLRGWADDADFAVPVSELAVEEVAEVDLVMMGSLSEVSESGLIAILGTSGDYDGSAFAGLIGTVGSEEGFGGLGLSGSGLGGGGTAEGLGGLGTIGHGDVAESGRRDRKREREEREAAELTETLLAAEIGYVEGNYLTAEMDGVEGGYEGGVIGGVVGGVEGGVEGGVVGGVVYGIVGGVQADSEPVLAYRADPEYPAAAREQGLSARCTAKIRVSADGRGKLSDVSGDCPNQFRAAVSDAIERSRWEAAIRGGVPVAETVTVVYTFDISAQ